MHVTSQEPHAHSARLAAHGWQVQQITFVQESQGHLRPGVSLAPAPKSTFTTRTPRHRSGAAAKGAAAGGGVARRAEVEPTLGFSEILVTRHLMHHRHKSASQRAPVRRRRSNPHLTSASAGTRTSPPHPLEPAPHLRIRSRC